MKCIILLIISFECFTTIKGFAQRDTSYFNNKYNISTKYKNNKLYKIYDFSREKSTIKAKFFAVDAYHQYKKWKSDKEILLVTEAAFSTTTNPNHAMPVGLVVDNGISVNRNVDHTMDGLVILWNEGRQRGSLAIVDLSERPIRVEKRYETGIYEDYYPRFSSTDRFNFVRWCDDNKASVFQTQLVYSKDKATNFSNLHYGNKRERRLLALCYKENELHHLIIDVPLYEYLNMAAKEVKEVLEEDGFNVLYLLNFDRGSGDMLYVYNGSFLEEIVPRGGGIESARNLLVYYKDKDEK